MPPADDSAMPAPQAAASRPVVERNLPFHEGQHANPACDNVRGPPPCVAGVGIPMPQQPDTVRTCTRDVRRYPCHRRSALHRSPRVQACPAARPEQTDSAIIVPTPLPATPRRRCRSPKRTRQDTYVGVAAQPQQCLSARCIRSSHGTSYSIFIENNIVYNY